MSSFPYQQHFHSVNFAIQGEIFLQMLDFKVEKSVIIKIVIQIAIKVQRITCVEYFFMFNMNTRNDHSEQNMSMYICGIVIKHYRQ